MDMVFAAGAHACARTSSAALPAKQLFLKRSDVVVMLGLCFVIVFCECICLLVPLKSQFFVVSRRQKPLTCADCAVTTKCIALNERLACVAPDYTAPSSLAAAAYVVALSKVVVLVVTLVVVTVGGV